MTIRIPPEYCDFGGLVESPIDGMRVGRLWAYEFALDVRKDRKKRMRYKVI